MRRRRLLVTAAPTLPATIAECESLGAAGTTGTSARYATGRLRLQPITPVELPSRVLNTIQTGGSNNENVDLFLQALDGPASTTGFEPPLPGNEHYAYDGTVYELSYEAVEEMPAISYWVHLTPVTTTIADSGAVQFAELPAVDREKLRAQSLADGDQLDVATTFVYTRAERDESVLVPWFEQSYIRWPDGTTSSWEVKDRTDKTLQTYEYTTSRVASVAVYGRELRDRFVFELTDVPAGERDILERAQASSGFSVTAADSGAGAFASLVDRFRAHQQVHALDEGPESGVSGPYVVRFQTDEYWAWLMVRPDQVQ